MLRPEWHDSIQQSEWQMPKDDKAVLYAQVYIILRNPSLKPKPGKPIGAGYMRGFYQNVAVPSDAPDEQKETALARGRAWLIDGFNKLYNEQKVFLITEETEPLTGPLVKKYVGKV